MNERSREDLALTKGSRQAGRFLGMLVLDRLITGGNSMYCSLDIAVALTASAGPGTGADCGGSGMYAACHRASYGLSLYVPGTRGPAHGSTYERERTVLGHKVPALLQHFADGREVRPEAIDPELVLVKSECPTADLFRFTTLLWSVPVRNVIGEGCAISYMIGTMISSSASSP